MPVLLTSEFVTTILSWISCLLYTIQYIHIRVYNSRLSPSPTIRSWISCPLEALTPRKEPACMYAYVYTCTVLYVCIYACTYIHTYYLHADTHINFQAAYMQTCIHAHLHTCTHVYLSRLPRRCHAPLIEPI